MYLNIFSDIYFSLIQSMKSVLTILISQNIKVKIREEEQRLKNIINDDDEQAPNPNNIIVNTAKISEEEED